MLSRSSEPQNSVELCLLSESEVEKDGGEGIGGQIGPGIWVFSFLPTSKAGPLLPQWCIEHDPTHRTASQRLAVWASQGSWNPKKENLPKI